MKKLSQAADKYYPIMMGGLLILYMLANQMYRVQFHGRYVYLYFANLLCLGTLGYAFLKKKVIAVRMPFVNLMLLASFGAMCSTIHTVLARARILNSSVAFFQFLVLYVIVAYVQIRMHENIRILDLIVRVLKSMILLHCIYIVVQYVVYQTSGILLNEVVFGDLLGIELEGVWYKESMYCTGFTYSPPLLAPMFIMGILLFHNVFIRIFIAGCAFICRSSTALVGVVLCLFLLVLFSLIRRKVSFRTIAASIKKAPKWQLILGGLAIIAVIAAVIFTGLYRTAWEEVEYLFERIASIKTAKLNKRGYYTSSAASHVYYYKNWFEIWSQTSIRQIIFGYGNGTSGYPMRYLLGNKLYPKGAGIVECDYVDTALSQGILGLVAFYGTQLYILLKGRKLDDRYAVLAICYLVMALGYNIQWHYNLFFIFIIAVCLHDDIDFFGAVDRRKL